MKRCGKCGTTYYDDSLYNYCCLDGTILSRVETTHDAEAKTLSLHEPYAQSDQACLSKLNRFFKIGRMCGRDFYCYGVTRTKPALIPLGSYQLTDLQTELAKEQRKRLANLRSETEPNKSFQYRNDLHAILKGSPIWTETDIFLPFEELDYAGLWALRETGQRPQVLSISAILFCEEKEEMYLHRRSPEAATHPHELHTFGGAYMPRATDQRQQDIDLFDTARRKLKEEAIGIDVTIKRDSVMLLAKETDTGFIQLIIPINIPQSEIDRMKHPLEGGTKMTYAFSVLKKTLTEPEIPWAATGKAQILSWLALGAPNCAESSHFGTSRSPVELFDEVTKNR